MISPKTPAAPAGISNGAGPSTRTAALPPSSVVSAFLSTTHDALATAPRVTDSWQAHAAAEIDRHPSRLIGTSQNFVHR